MVQDFDMGFISALASFAIGAPSGGGGLPQIATLCFVNCDYYRGDYGHCANYLTDTEYSSILSSSLSYIPKKGGIVMIGTYQLEDWDDYSGETPRAIIRITVDGKVIVEQEVATFFTSKYLKEAKLFSYKSTFNIEAKRLNLTDSMSLEFYQTQVIGYK